MVVKRHSAVQIRAIAGQLGTSKLYTHTQCTGDVLLMRAELLDHWVAKFDGKRYGFVAFWHQGGFAAAGGVAEE